jgi:hypothetical protein
VFEVTEFGIFRAIWIVDAKKPHLIPAETKYSSKDWSVKLYFLFRVVVQSTLAFDVRACHVRPGDIFVT